ncbi:NAD(P)-binding domain-containing protein [Phenylobacterium sp.]|uniref:NAD(P)-binding domain-containing protein n=1 Tax=Phenylobacterium sp. TaxID=1871053 RepID=UPI0035B3C9AB
MTKTIGVMGLGLMGSAIAARLLEMRSPVVVWNRTAARAAPLVDAGAEWVETPAALFAAADVVIAITASTAEVEAAVGASGARLARVDFINLVTGSPRQVRALKGAVEAVGGRFFSGTLQRYPAEIGQAEALILCAGDEGVWERQADVIRGLGGAAVNLGADAAIAPGRPMAWPRTSRLGASASPTAIRSLRCWAPPRRARAPRKSS